MDEIFENKLDSKTLSFDEYKSEYEKSINDPISFWSEKAKKLDWIKPFSKVNGSSFDGNVKINWFEDGKLNVSYNCLDRHLEKLGDKTAIIWESDDPNLSKKISYKDLYTEVCKFSNGKKVLV